MATNKTAPTTVNRLFFVAGLVVLGLGLGLSERLLAGLSPVLGIGLNLGGAEGLARIWVLKIVLVVVGLPLLVYPFRNKRAGKTVFDVSMGLVFMVMLLLLVEGGFYLLNRSRPASNLFRYAVTYSEPLVELDDFTGYKLRPNLRVLARQTGGERVIYEVLYEVDEYGRRVTPVDNPAGRTNFILFFGGSFTFGDGVAGHQTLPAQVGRLAPAYMPYNYGVPGYGTQQVMARLQIIEPEREVPEAQGMAVYSFICPHIDRVIGSLVVQNNSGTYMPYYTLDANDNLVRRGTLASGRPVASVVYAVLDISQIPKYFNLTIPRHNNSHYHLTARIIQETARSFAQKFNNRPFYVLLFPGSGQCASALIPHLDEQGISYLDYSGLFNGAGPDLYLPDGHPTARAYRLVAEALVQDLQIQNKN